MAGDGRSLIREIAQRRLILFRTIQIAQGLKCRIDVGQLVRLHDPSGDGIEEKNGAQSTFLKKTSDVIGDLDTIDPCQRMVIAFDPRHADRVVPQQLNQPANKRRT